MGALVKIHNYLYGSGTSKKQFKSINTSTGELTDSVKLGWGAVISADNMLYYYSQNGNLSLLSFKDGKMKEQGQFKIVRGTKEHFSYSEINKGILYQCRADTLMAFDIRKKV
jgi:hypothetical protein